MPRVCNISFKTFHDYYQEFITAQYSELLLTPTHTNTGLVLLNITSSCQQCQAQMQPLTHKQACLAKRGQFDCDSAEDLQLKYVPHPLFSKVLIMCAHIGKYCM